MINSLYIIGGLILTLWAIITYGFNSFRYTDILLIIAGFIILLRILYPKNRLEILE